MQFKILVWALVLLGFFWFSIPVLAEAVCGNGTCEGPFLGGNENPCTCPLDCGSCAPSPYEVCHEYLPCEDTNNVCTVILVPSCCGNELCEGLEDFGNCPRDCDPETLDIELVSPVLDAPFARGQEGSFAVKLSSAGRELFDAQILATGFLEPFNYLMMASMGMELIWIIPMPIILQFRMMRVKESDWSQLPRPFEAR